MDMTEIPAVDPDVVAERIRILHAESGLTKGAYAKHVGTSYQSLFLWLNGYRVPTFQSLYRISRQSRVSIPWLLGEVPIGERGEDEL
ncbi:helix-turn-helix domain-containing protein [Actinophytocola sp. NPDC049390]|uniref:helix-turn-helix domain-containing protein n=1 Tax=Actinophytocola sp. NPDC049390 TaxID=3363894 RepID=UPI003789D089